MTASALYLDGEQPMESRPLVGGLLHIPNPNGLRFDKVSMTTTINITWHQPDERSQGREDSAWYTYSPDHHDIIATVSNGERTVHIYADGEQRVHIPYEVGDWSKGHHVVRSSDEWSAHNINNDKDIFEASESGLLDWINNSWFDLYADEQGWSDCVQHTLTDAIASAHELLADNEYWETV